MVGTDLTWREIISCFFFDLSDCGIASGKFVVVAAFIVRFINETGREPKFSVLNGDSILAGEDQTSLMCLSLPERHNHNGIGPLLFVRRRRLCTSTCHVVWELFIVFLNCLLPEGKES
jgi:hypothetical protein